jgi:hypothetical protein
MTKSFANHRALIGLASAGLYIFAAILLQGKDNGVEDWASIFALLFALTGEWFVMASPYKELIRFAIPWHADRSRLDEREVSLRLRAMETSYVVTALLFVIVWMPLSFFSTLEMGVQLWWFAVAFSAILFMMPTIVLEWIGPGGALIGGAEEEDYA